MDIEKMRELEQALHASSVQTQNLQAELGEIENALAELAESEEAYRIVGNLMVKTAPEKMQTELSARQDLVSRRLDAIRRQGESLHKQMDEMKSTILGEKNE